MFVVASLEIQYKAPTKLDDQLMVTAELTQLKCVLMILKQPVLRGGKAIVAANFNFVTVSNEAFKPITIAQLLSESSLIN